MLLANSTVWHRSSVPIVRITACLVDVESKCACLLLWLPASSEAGVVEKLGE